MIVRSKPKVWELFMIFRLSILPQIAWQLAVVVVFSAGLVVVSRMGNPAARYVGSAFRNWSVAPFTLLGVAISIFLEFRNSACYDRWWEARRQLGALIGEMSSFARLAVTTPVVDRARRERWSAWRSGMCMR